MVLAACSSKDWDCPLVKRFLVTNWLVGFCIISYIRLSFVMHVVMTLSERLLKMGDQLAYVSQRLTLERSAPYDGTTTRGYGLI